MVGVNFGETTTVDNKEEFEREINKRKMKNSEEVSIRIKNMLLNDEELREYFFKEEV